MYMIEKINICIKLTKIGFLVTDENMGLCLYMPPRIILKHLKIEQKLLKSVSLVLGHQSGWKVNQCSCIVLGYMPVPKNHHLNKPCFWLIICVRFLPFLLTLPTSTLVNLKESKSRWQYSTTNVCLSSSSLSSNFLMAIHDVIITSGASWNCHFTGHSIIKPSFDGDHNIYNQRIS